MHHYIKQLVWYPCHYTMRWRTVFLFKAALSAFPFVLRLFGMFPYSFDEIGKRVKLSKSCMLYTVVYLMAYAVALVQYSLMAMRARIMEKRNNSILLLATYSTIYLNGIFACLVGLIYRKRIHFLYNQFIQLWHLLSSDVPKNFDKKLFYRFAFKLLALDGLALVVGIVVRLRTYLLTRNRPALYDALWIGFFLGMNASVTNLFVAVGYIGAHLHRLLNYRLLRINEKLHNIEHVQHYWRMNPAKKLLVLKKMNTELHQLALWHGEINQLTQGFMDVHGLSLFMTVLKDFVVIITGFFGTYMLVVIPLERNQTPEIVALGFNLYMAIFYCCQFFFLVESGAMFTRRADKTGLIIDDFGIPKTNENIDNTIEMISLELLHRNNAIENCGLYKLDFSLMYTSFTSMATYLILAVQFQMKE
ncbi:uncharacterized protein LOC131431135 isoform X2 [Malaya genurostris]|uniref:uncharacterized protein LOC131431135 isoform X2 n=1 Tax=Malaya genurostris TaxID=325434 RepID=UPI0026F3AEB4|nr:uncharacterized protein LOC131431135 isoform X2 [Malaya genurostris]